MDCSGNLSSRRKWLCQALTTERASSIIDSDRNSIPFCVPSYTYQRNQELHQSEWQTHPNWPTQTILLTAHRHFRGISKDIVSGIYEIYENYLETRELIQMRSLKTTILKILQSYQEELIIHAKCEESGLFPLMRERYWKQNEMENLSSQHDSLDQKLEQLHQSLENLNENTSIDEIELLLITAIEADDILLHHLAYEEDSLIPILLTLPSEIFQSLVIELKVN